jgi:crotonobetainyl-CoA:carnitine CoA-transferase CaiB-like acyl-CoA transferase
MAAQGLGGIISITGEADGLPSKVPVAVNDVITGLYASISILAALKHRDLTGQGQQIDLALLDVQVAWLYNQGVNYLLSGEVPERLGTGHPNIVPYQAFEASDGFIILGAANEDAFYRFCEFTENLSLLDDPRFCTNANRVRNRKAANSEVQKIIGTKSADFWVSELSRLNITCSRVNTIDQVFEDPQVQARKMTMEMDHPLAEGDPIRLISSPIKMSETPVTYRYPPPTLGQHTDEILSDVLGLDEAMLNKLRTDGII